MNSSKLRLHGDDEPELIYGDHIKIPFDCDLQRLVDEIRTAGDIIISGETILKATKESENETIQDY